MQTAKCRLVSSKRPVFLGFSIRNPQSEIRNRFIAFSLIEMLIALAVIAVLLSLVFMVGRSAVNNAKVKDTQAMIVQVDTAVKTFADENPFRSVKDAQKRYGAYPPDDVLTYTPTPANGGAEHGTVAGGRSTPNLMPGGIGQYFKFGTAVSVLTDNITANAQDYVANGDIKALCWALQVHDKTRVIYDSIQDRFRKTADFAGTSGEFFDFDLNGTADSVKDKEVQYLVDGWGNPLQYFATRSTNAAETPTPHGAVSTLLIEANRNLPVLVSYGPDGKDQIAANQALEWNYDMGAGGTTVFDKLSNDDNLYNDEQMKINIKNIKKP